VSAVTKPLPVLSPKIVRQGASIGLWGSGFHAERPSTSSSKSGRQTSSDPVTFVQAEPERQFGGVRLTVPDSVSLGALIIQATEGQGSLTAAAAATVRGADDPQVGIQVGTAVAIPTAGTIATPTAAAMASQTPAPKASPTTVATPGPTAVLNVASLAHVGYRMEAD
jgi:hypothetical protein